MTTKQQSEQSRYVRLNQTTLYRVPSCYGGRGKPDPLSDACVHCFLKKQCREKQGSVKTWFISVFSSKIGVCRGDYLIEPIFMALSLYSLPQPHLHLSAYLRGGR